MTEQQIKRAKRLAEILFSKGNYEVQERGSAVWVRHNWSIEWRPFNPEQDEVLLCDLKIAYQIDVSNNGNHQWDIEGWTQGMNHVYRSTELTKDQLPAALIDCVIEINGGYDEQS